MVVFGPNIIERTLSAERSFGSKGKQSRYQYHPRSDHHSKLACWCIAFDLMRTSNLLQGHVAEGKVTIGINHEMLDFRQRRKKNLDLVIARPATFSDTKATSLADLSTHLNVLMSESEERVFESLPPVLKQPVGAVLVALEAKACMTEHGKSEPRLYDELNSSQQTVHGANDAAIACGLVMVNRSETFVSPIRQNPALPLEVTVHKQPQVTESVISKIRQLPRRTQPGADGFDALGIMVIDLRNDGSLVTVDSDAPGPHATDGDSYEDMITRVASLYDYRFATI